MCPYDSYLSINLCREWKLVNIRSSPRTTTKPPYIISNVTTPFKVHSEGTSLLCTRLNILPTTSSLSIRFPFLVVHVSETPIDLDRPDQRSEHTSLFQTSFSIALPETGGNVSSSFIISSQVRDVNEVNTLFTGDSRVLHGSWSLCPARSCLGHGQEHLGYWIT